MNPIATSIVLFLIICLGEDLKAPKPGYAITCNLLHSLTTAHLVFKSNNRYRVENQAYNIIMKSQLREALFLAFFLSRLGN